MAIPASLRKFFILLPCSFFPICGFAPDGANLRLGILIFNCGFCIYLIINFLHCPIFVPHLYNGKILCIYRIRILIGNCCADVLAVYFDMLIFFTFLLPCILCYATISIGDIQMYASEKQERERTVGVLHGFNGQLFCGKKKSGA